MMNFSRLCQLRLISQPYTKSCIYLLKFNAGLNNWSRISHLAIGNGADRKSGIDSADKGRAMPHFRPARGLSNVHCQC